MKWCNETKIKTGQNFKLCYFVMLCVGKSFRTTTFICQQNISRVHNSPCKVNMYLGKPQSVWDLGRKNILRIYYSKSSTIKTSINGNPQNQDWWKIPGLHNYNDKKIWVFNYPDFFYHNTFLQYSDYFILKSLLIQGVPA